MTPGFLIALALEGLIITSIGLVVYSTGFRHFKTLDHEFDTKETAQVTLVIFLIFAGILGDPLLTYLRQLLDNISLIQQIGVLAIISRGVVNAMVHHWRHDDTISRLFYLTGTGCILLPTI